MSDRIIDGERRPYRKPTVTEVELIVDDALLADSIPTPEPPFAPFAPPTRPAP